MTRTLLAFLVLLLLPSLVSGRNVFAPPAGDGDDVNSHADRCRAVLGRIPSFDCADGKALEATLEGTPHTTGTLPCDRPSVAAGYDACRTGARLGKKTHGKVDWVFLCRAGRNFVDPSKPRWAPVALIGANRLTGETCFFDSTGNDTGRAPAPGGAGPDDVEGRKASAKFWSNESGKSCLHCHTNNQAWIVTPYLSERVLETGGDGEIVPIVPLIKRIRPGWGYRVIDAKVPSPLAIAPKDVDGSEDRTCTGCHTITPGFYGNTLVRWATGAVGLELGGDSLSPWAKKFPQAFWMPLGHAAESEAEWKSRFTDPVARLRHCLDNDDTTRCLPRRPVLAPCPVPAALSAAAVERLATADGVELRWRYDNALGDVPERDDLRFVVEETDAAGVATRFEDLVPVSTGRWRYVSRTGVSFRLTARRYCWSADRKTADGPPLLF